MRKLYALVGADGKPCGKYYGYMPINAGKKIATKILNISSVEDFVFRIVRYEDGKIFTYRAVKRKLPAPKAFFIGAKVLYRKNLIKVIPYREINF